MIARRFSGPRPPFDELRRLKARYCLYLDTKRWPDWRGLFTTDLRVEGARQSADGGRDAFVDAVSVAFADVRTVHRVFEPIIELVDRHEARALWPMFDEVTFPAGHPWAVGPPGHRRRVGHGYYEEQYRRVDGRWLIARFRLSRLTLDWRPDVVPVDGELPAPDRGWLEGGGAGRARAGAGRGA